MNPPETHDDAAWMRRALKLAARGYTPPNPRVGCVLVRDGRIAGEGWHQFAGGPHAEASALQNAGAAARGATAYVTLEPCSHHGRTPPCAEALIRAGVARVVAAMGDPNPLVAGKGFERLKSAGIEVEQGVLEAEACAINAPYLHFHATGRPWVTLKAAVTLDGKIATRTGDSRWITGVAARRFAHRERALHCAALVGIGTALADDPELTARIPGVVNQPARIVLDTHLRLSERSRMAQTAGEVRTIAVCTEMAPEERAGRLRELGMEILSIPADSKGRIPVPPLLEALGGLGIISVLVEGGGSVHASFLEARAANRLLWFVAPRIAGGREAPTSVEGCGVARMADALSLSRFKIRRLGADLLLECSPGFPETDDA